MTKIVVTEITRTPWWSACFCAEKRDWKYTSAHDDFYCTNCYSWRSDPLCSSGNCTLCINRPLINEEAKAFDEKMDRSLEDERSLEDDLISSFGVKSQTSDYIERVR